jgi:sortase A
MLMMTPAGHPLYVLAGLSGDTLAFGPGTPTTGSAPGEVGTTIIAGHKNTHFSFLQHLSTDDVIRIQNRSGRWYRYRIVGMHVVNSKTSTIPVQYQRDEIVLTTCYPFGPGHWDSPLRYVVHGVRI